ncbi:flagellar protein [Paenibacillus sp. IHB B 3084]|uniref:flagellar biosynthetic protein FliO n=1 Tax=Paenibacillus TaxID=44249 RepID=UPI00071F2857|nr:MULTISPECIES: flagellar biosynthetic protein FliO [Paenibacillus]ALP35017.1 flagellar protein [Paenibacillus sp. IHB B 3084]MBE0335421.1 flagellar protein [Paenibacillus sp. 23TSA30-6]
MDTKQGASDALSTSSNIGNIAWVLFVLIFIIVLIVYLIRFLSKRNQSWFSNRSVRILGGVGLGPNKSLQLVEVGSSVYLIGVGEDIRLVDKVSDPEEVEQILAALEQEASLQRGPIAPLFAKIAGKLRRNTAAQQQPEEETSFHEMFESKLRQMPNRKDKLEKLRNEENTTDRSGDS